MIKSMTGYGISKVEHELFDVSVEVKSLNSKTLDANLRGLPRQFNSKEVAIRNILSQTLNRGKVTVSIELTDKKNATSLASVNTEMFKTYHAELKQLATEVGDDHVNLFSEVLKLPKVIETKSEEIEEDVVWEALERAFRDAISRCTAHREDEGRVLQEKLASYINVISKSLEEVLKQDPLRVEKVRERINKHIEEYVAKEKIDESRFEQEMIFYIEKLDITEEKVRLKNHLEYFISIMNSNETNGKKLGFIGQEIGREINTIGSKSNDAVMQKLVVSMKDELEKIKEQVLNVL